MSSDLPEGSQGTKSNRPKRHAASFRPSNRSIPDLIHDPANKSNITDEQTARAELEARLFITPAAEINIDTLATALLDFTVQAHSLTPMHIDIMRAIAILMLKTDQETKAQIIAESINKLINNPITRLEEIIKNQFNKDDQSNTTRTEGAIDIISNKLEEVKTTVENLSPSLKLLQEGLTNTENIDTRFDKLQQNISTLTSRIDQLNQQGSYKAALLAGTRNGEAPNPQEVQRLARDAIKACQVLININPDSPIAPGKVSHEQLVAKIKEALKTISNPDSPDLDIRAVNQYRNGGTVIQMLNEDAAKYIKQQVVKEGFINALDPSAIMKDRSYPVIIQFVPLTFNPSDQNQIQQLEQENGWESDSVTMARWVKPPEKRTSTQRVAHLLISFKDPKIANLGIRDGITLNHNKLQLKKNKREPVRCAKCQHYGHIAKECLARQDTCANCAEEHRTSECRNKDTTHCVSCQTSDHASWDRNCPELERRCIDLEHRDPSTTMPYYPTDEIWTQAQAPPKAKTQPRPQQTLNPPPTQQTQNTIDRHFPPRGARPARGSYLSPNVGFSHRQSSNSPPPPSQYRPPQPRPRSRSRPNTPANHQHHNYFNV